MKIEERNRECNTSNKATIGIRNEMTSMRREPERASDEAGAAGAALPSTKVEVCRIASKIYRER